MAALPVRPPASSRLVRAWSWLRRPSVGRLVAFVAVALLVPGAVTGALWGATAAGAVGSYGQFVAVAAALAYAAKELGYSGEQAEHARNARAEQRWFETLDRLSAVVLDFAMPMVSEALQAPDELRELLDRNRPGGPPAPGEARSFLDRAVPLNRIAYQVRAAAEEAQVLREAELAGLLRASAEAFEDAHEAMVAPTPAWLVGRPFDQIVPEGQEYPLAAARAATVTADQLAQGGYEKLVRAKEGLNCLRVVPKRFAP